MTNNNNNTNNNIPNNNNFKLHIREDEYSKFTISTCLIPKDVYYTFKRLCNYKNRTISETIRQLIKAYVKVNKHILPKT